MTSLIEDYVFDATQRTDAPIEYHRALGLTLMSSIIGRVPIAVTPNPMFTNGYTCLLGRATKDRKTTSLEILDKALPSCIPRIANEFSREALLAELSKTPQAIGFFDECGGLLKNIKNPRHYLSGMDDTFCSLYSATSDYVRKLRSETFTIREPYLNLAWATTLRKFKSAVSVDSYTSGFIARIRPVIAEKPATLPRRNMDMDDQRRRDELKAKAQGTYDFFHKTQCSFKFDPSALKMISAWQTNKESVEYDNEDINDAYGTVASRMGDYVIKDSALFEVDKLTSKVGSSLSTLSLSNLVNSPIVLSTDSVQKSMDYNDNLLSVISTNLLNSLSETGFSKYLVKLSKIVRRCANTEGWAERQHVLPQMNMKANAFEEVLQTAVQSGEIECQTKDRKQLLRVVLGAE